MRLITKKSAKIAMITVTVLLLLIFVIDNSIIGFTLDKNNINSYITAQLAEKYEKTVIELTELQSIARGSAVSSIYEYVCDDGENGYLAIALLKSIIFNKSKATNMFLLLEKADENYSGILLSEGYIKTYIYNTNNRTLDYAGEFNKISCGVPVVWGGAVFLICIIRILWRHKQGC